MREAAISFNARISGFNGSRDMAGETAIAERKPFGSGITNAPAENRACPRNFGGGGGGRGGLGICRLHWGCIRFAANDSDAVHDKPSVADHDKPSVADHDKPSTIAADKRRPRAPSDQHWAGGEGAGLLLEAYAAYGDPRLPAEYRGSAPLPSIHNPLLDDVVAAWPSLEAVDRDRLIPWLLPPYVAGSAWDSDPTSTSTAPMANLGAASLLPKFDCKGLSLFWSHKTTPSGRIKVWWLSADKKMETFTAVVLATADDAWNKVASILGRAPPGDGGGFCDGFDNAFDITIMKQGAFGDVDARTFSDGACPRSSYIKFPVLNPVDAYGGLVAFGLMTKIPALSDAVSALLVHEFTHAIHNNMKMAGTPNGCLHPVTDNWFSEGMATWAMHAAYPTLDVEHRYGQTLLDNMVDSVAASPAQMT